MIFSWSTRTGSLLFSSALFSFSIFASASAAEKDVDVSYGRDMLHQAFEHEVQAIETEWFDGIATLDDWEKRRIELRRQLAEMLGLWPELPKTDLKPTIVGTVDHPEFTVEKLHFQSLPGLYVTANLYLPKNTKEKPPIVLYLSGHARSIVDGVSYGTKVPYQHNPIWYARQGMASLIIDSLDRGEIQGVHHGTYRFDRWWWYNRGYTPGAIEVWNAIRAIDFLETRSDLDSDRIGTTGRSGGGIYSWLLLALDDRVKTGTPTAGLTDLRDHLITDVIRGHCDCNYWNNFHRLDPTVLAALAAPRPVRLLNSDNDKIFPVGGISRIEERVAKVYALYGKEDHWDVYISEGPHRDTRELQLASYPWMYRWLMGEEIDEVPETGPLFEREELQVFPVIPADEINTTVDTVFRPKVDTPELPETRWEWELMKSKWMNALSAQTFAGWPAENPDATAETLGSFEVDGLRLDVHSISPQPAIELRTWTFTRSDRQPKNVIVRVLDHAEWLETLAAWQAAAPGEVEEMVGPGAHSVAWPEADATAWEDLKEIVSDENAVVLFAPRGVGPTFYEEDRPDRGDTITRSFQMLGQTLAGMQIWDLRSALSAIRTSDRFANSAIEIEAEGVMAGVALYASLFDEPLHRLHLTDLPSNHDDGPILLNIDQITDLPQIYGMARERSEIKLSGDSGVSEWSDGFFHE
ncbi:MAG TPA: CocE/NonD family hydrolase [Opitutales bacterium]|nr:CocE/NonD family hydrolase [Opitutales bacterium]